MKEFVITWRLQNFSYSWHEGRQLIVSPRFVSGPLYNTCWTLILYPRGSENSDYLSLFLYREKDRIPKDIAVNFEFSCISADTSALHSCFIPETFVTFEKSRYSGFGESRFIQRHEIFGRRKALYLPRDTLTLRCRMWKVEGDANEFGEIFGCTRLITERITSKENICFENKEEKIFFIHSNCQNEELFSIKILSHDDKIDLEINPIGENKMKSSTCKLSFVDKKTGIKLCENLSSFFGGPQKELWRLPFSDKVLRARNGDPDTSNFEFITEIVYSTGEVENIIEQDCPSNISEFLSNYINSCTPGCKTLNRVSMFADLWNLYAEQEFCDVELKTQNKSFFVHKIVLCARSPVFLAMLTGEMKEKKHGCIEIVDIADNTLQILLAFLYTDSFEDLEWDTLLDVYYASDKYQIGRLKFLCCSQLLNYTGSDHVCELLILADRHHDCNLRQKVYDFIWANEEEVFRSPTWKKFASDQHQLAIQTFLSKYEEKENHDVNKTYDVELSNIQSIEDDFKSLFESHIANDVVIKTANSTFPAHKTILCASSSTFKELFRIDSVNKPIDLLEMENWEDDTISRMLIFLYTDSLENIQWDTAMKLYQLASAYEIRRLQIKCSCFLLERLSVTNASNLLLLADEHRDVALKSVVEDYICQYDEEIFGSDEWAAFCETNSQLALVTMRAKYKKNK